MKKFIKIPFIFSLLLIINLTLIVSTFADADEECKPIEENSPFIKLRNYLFCEYESVYLSTLDTKNGTNVTLGIAPRKFYFDEELGNLELFGWFVIHWEDPHLTWEPDDFEKITHLKIRSYRIWDPQVVIFSGGNEDTNVFGLPNTHCYVSSGGRVVCVPQVRHTIRCRTDFTQWPFDRQNCTLVFSTWIQSKQNIHFVDRGNDTIVMHVHEGNGEWTLTASRVTFDERKSFFSKNQETTSPRLSIDFILDRTHNHLSGRFISPAIIMMVMTLTTLWLDPRSIERLSLACVNPIIHLYCMQDVHWALPHNGSTVPNLLLFYANSLVLSTLALVLTFILGSIEKIKIKPPTSISSFVATILRSKIGQILLLSMLDPKVAAKMEPDGDDSGDLVKSHSKTTAWNYITIMFSWILFLVFFFTYIIMYAILVPNASMKPLIERLGYEHAE